MTIVIFNKKIFHLYSLVGNLVILNILYSNIKNEIKIYIYKNEIVWLQT